MEQKASQESKIFETIWDMADQTRRKLMEFHRRLYAIDDRLLGGSKYSEIEGKEVVKSRTGLCYLILQELTESLDYCKYIDLDIKLLEKHMDLKSEEEKIPIK